MHYKTLSQVSTQLAEGEVSSVELTEAMLQRIASLNSTYNAYVQVFEEEARAAAIRADQMAQQKGRSGPLHGVPVAVKDLFDVAGTPTGCASTIRQDHIASKNATVVEKLQAAGAIILGKTNMTEFALSGYHPDLPVPLNPWNKDRWAGVSSSGSGVATALGMSYATLGSDTGGSIRFPSAANGVTGIKPTFGTVSKHGAFPLSFTLDHVGPITRSVEDAATVLQAIAGFDSADPFSIEGSPPDFLANMKMGIDGLKIGLDRTFCTTNVDPDVTTAVLKAAEQLESLGATLVEVDVMPVLETAQFWGVVVAAEAALVHKETFPSQKEQYGPVFRDLLELAPNLRATDYAAAREASARAQMTFNMAFSKSDLLLCPGAPAPAMPLSEFGPTTVLPAEAVASFTGLTAPMNFTGLPTISVPCGFSTEHLPIGLQFVGPYHSEPTLIQAAYAYEQSTQWHQEVPPIP